MSTRRLRRFGPAALMLLAACEAGNNAHRVTASAYSTSCQRGSDCVAITEGEVGCCGLLGQCPNAAILLMSLTAYFYDVHVQMPMCSAPPQCPSDPGCPLGALTCPNNRCAFHHLDVPDGGAATTISAADYGRACETVADCVPIYEGSIGCCGVGCPNTAIREDAQDQYKRHLDERTPSCVPLVTCEPPPPCASGRIDCQSGVCVLLTPPVQGTDAR